LWPEPKLQKTALPRRSRAPAKLQQDVQSARDSLQKGTDQLRETAEANQGRVAAWWSDVQTSWDDQIATIRRDIESKKAEHDLKAAQRNADDAEEDAKFPIAYAYWGGRGSRVQAARRCVGSEGRRKLVRGRQLIPRSVTEPRPLSHCHMGGCIPVLVSTTRA
jgi:hypothetical protein